MLTLVQGDITKQEVDAVVNAAHTLLSGGGGVDGAIHRAGGPSILEECKKIIARQEICPTGEAVLTTGGDLPAKQVIHTAGPVWEDGLQREDELLASAYRNSINVAKENNIRTIAFPSISTGAYRFPVERAAKIALATVTKEVGDGFFDEVRFVLFTEEVLAVYQKALEALEESG